ncbi:hypothetical protein BLNAU_17174 [Blattamonas nauphoetae]|uniref:Protein kinase domain-containing protein n=1 Tax=Blattamonas nauphoetae TaxID=2049346 RepID=A0ABQ9X7T9_9EUKA|nr:hypothetical protein BLNAU_17174 [Blattamonas nauphoetae]
MKLRLCLLSENQDIPCPNPDWHACCSQRGYHPSRHESRKRDDRRKEGQTHCDSGEARQVNTTQENAMFMTSFKGSPIFMSPELVTSDQRVQYDERVDVWSLGVTLFQMVYGGFPWRSTNKYQLHGEMMAAFQLKMGHMIVSQELLSIFSWCMQKKNKQFSFTAQLLSYHKINEFTHTMVNKYVSKDDRATEHANLPPPDPTLTLRPPPGYSNTKTSVEWEKNPGLTCTSNKTHKNKLPNLDKALNHSHLTQVNVLLLLLLPTILSPLLLRIILPLPTLSLWKGDRVNWQRHILLHQALPRADFHFNNTRRRFHPLRPPSAANTRRQRTIFLRRPFPLLCPQAASGNPVTTNCKPELFDGESTPCPAGDGAAPNPAPASTAISAALSEPTISLSADTTPTKASDGVSAFFSESTAWRSASTPGWAEDVQNVFFSSVLCFHTTSCFPICMSNDSFLSSVGMVPSPKHGKNI